MEILPDYSLSAATSSHEGTAVRIVAIDLSIENIITLSLKIFVANILIALVFGIIAGLVYFLVIN